MNNAGFTGFGGGIAGNILMMSAMKENVGVGQLMVGMAIIQLIGLFPVVWKAIMGFFNAYGARILIRIIERICNRFGMSGLYGELYEYCGFAKWVSIGVVQSVEEKVVKSSIFFQNSGGSTGDDAKRANVDENVRMIIEALNSHICGISENRYLFFYKQYYSLMREPFLIAPDVWCHVQGTKDTRNVEIFIENYSILLFSYVLNLTELKKVVDEMRKRYEYEINNKLGNQKYFFDEQHVSLPMDSEGNIRFDMALKEMTFSMTAFHTNKSFNNLFGNHLKVLKERVHLFIDNPKWYMERGIPHTLGVLLHGPPGTGKTSVIKAIAKDTNRHIFNIKLSTDTTQTQMRNLFFKERVVVNNGGTNIVFNIPLDERIYVLEDVDCLTDVVYKRDKKQVVQDRVGEKEKNIGMSRQLNHFSHMDNEIVGYSNDSMFMEAGSQFTISDVNKNQEIKPFKREKDLSENGEKLNLSFLLNLLDGILETPNRILIMTTNYPEKLDDALVRAGRIDIKVRVGNCNVDMIKEIYGFFYGEKELDLGGKTGDTKITPADMNKICIDNFNDPEGAYKELIAEVGK
jgi:hypothetical protein